MWRLMWHALSVRPSAAGALGAAALGRAVQVDPIKPPLKPPGTWRLKLKYDEPLSNLAFNFNLRHYSWAPPRCCRRRRRHTTRPTCGRFTTT